MARTKSRKAAPARQARATSRKKTTVATTEVELVEEKKGLGLEEAVAIITAILLLLGFLFLDHELGSHYDAGMFF